jgi:hypothetical protein
LPFKPFFAPKLRRVRPVFDVQSADKSTKPYHPLIQPQTGDKPESKKPLSCLSKKGSGVGGIFFGSPAVPQLGPVTLRPRGAPVLLLSENIVAILLNFFDDT